MVLVFIQPEGFYLTCFRTMTQQAVTFCREPDIIIIIFFCHPEAPCQMGRSKESETLIIAVTVVHTTGICTDPHYSLPILKQRIYGIITQTSFFSDFPFFYYHLLHIILMQPKQAIESTNQHIVLIQLYDISDLFIKERCRRKLISFHFLGLRIIFVDTYTYNHAPKTTF